MRSFFCFWKKNQKALFFLRKNQSIILESIDSAILKAGYKKKPRKNET